MIIVGIGNLGRALLGYRGFGNQGFRVVAAFDVAPELVGTEIEGVTVHHLDQLGQVVGENGVRLGVVAVPSSAAQTVADQMVAAVIDGILNFAAVTLSLPEGVSKVGVDLAIELEQLTFAVVNNPKKS